MRRTQTSVLMGTAFALSLATSVAAEGSGDPRGGYHRHHPDHAMHHGSAGSGMGGMMRPPRMMDEGECHGAMRGSGPMMGGGGMMGMGRAGGMHGSAMMAFREMWSLDLTAEQREQIATIHDELHKQHWSLRGSLFDDESKLRRLYAAQPRDAKAIGAVYARIFDVRRQMIEATIAAGNRAEAVLTEAQREQLRSQ